MLDLRHICKTYYNNSTHTVALDDISLSFDKSEFVAVFGPSGCGKTTLLNIIGGLDLYTQADLHYAGRSFMSYRKTDVVIYGKSTSKFENSDWDYYRNERVGFIFQTYNLIPQISVIENVELVLTLSGVGKETRRKKAFEMLKKVNMEAYAFMKSSQLSSGQKQRVSIARALANDPEIILADEPIGALDSESGNVVMQLLKEIAKDKLVIMATHNEELASGYADRIIRLKDGKLVGDDANQTQKPLSTTPMISKSTTIPWYTALKLSYRNLISKWTRTVIATLAGSIGIAGIAIVLAIANGFGNQIEKIEAETLSAMPIAIYRNPLENSNLPLIYGPGFSYNETSWFAPIETSLASHTNYISHDYLQYLEAMNVNYSSGLSYQYGVRIPFLIRKEGSLVASYDNNIEFRALQSSQPYLESQYKLQAGRFPNSINDLVIIVDVMNQIDAAILTFLGIDSSALIGFDSVIGKEIVLGYNEDLNMSFNATTNVLTRSFDETTYENGLTLTIVGVLKGNQSGLETQTSGIFYYDTLEKSYVETNILSQFCLDLLAIDLFFVPIEERGNYVFQRRTNGCQDIPLIINIYPSSIDYKSNILAYLNAYNDDVSPPEKILYTDHAAVLSGLLGSISNNVMLVLFSLGIISLLASLMMIAILIYVGLLERTKEIGILRSLGASKKDIARVFNSETAMIGLFAGLFGVIVSFILSFPLNYILRGALIGFDDIVTPRISHAFILILLTVILTYVAGYIPARIAANKHPAVALRHES